VGRRAVDSYWLQARVALALWRRRTRGSLVGGRHAGPRPRVAGPPTGPRRRRTQPRRRGRGRRGGDWWTAWTCPSPARARSRAWSAQTTGSAAPSTRPSAPPRRTPTAPHCNPTAPRPPRPPSPRGRRPPRPPSPGSPPRCPARPRRGPAPRRRRRRGIPAKGGAEHAPGRCDAGGGRGGGGAEAVRRSSELLRRRRTAPPRRVSRPRPAGPDRPGPGACPRGLRAPPEPGRARRAAGSPGGVRGGLARSSGPGPTALLERDDLVDCVGSAINCTDKTEDAGTTITTKRNRACGRVEAACHG
jgi:hypothetical protein